jgi:hypothetical protein
MYFRQFFDHSFYISGGYCRYKQKRRNSELVKGGRNGK